MLEHLQLENVVQLRNLAAVNFYIQVPDYFSLHLPDHWYVQDKIPLFPSLSTRWILVLSSLAFCCFVRGSSGSFVTVTVNRLVFLHPLSAASSSFLESDTLFLPFHGAAVFIALLEDSAILFYTQENPRFPRGLFLELLWTSLGWLRLSETLVVGPIPDPCAHPEPL